jgi:hypothetical protein
VSDGTHSDCECARVCVAVAGSRLPPEGREGAVGKTRAGELGAFQARPRARATWLCLHAAVLSIFLLTPTLSLVLLFALQQRRRRVSR